MKTLKVLHVLHNYSGYSGASLQAKRLINKLSELGVEQSVLSTSMDGSGKRDDLKGIYYCGRRPFKRIVKVLYLFFFFRPSVVHFHGADFLILAVSKMFGIKVYWKTTLIGSDDFSVLSAGRFGLIKRVLIKMIDCNNAMTKTAFEVNQRYLNRKRIVTIPNGVIPLLYQHASMPTKTILMVGAIIPRKKVIEGVKYLLRVTDHEWDICIAGPCHNGLDGFDSSYKQQFDKIVEESFRITYLGEVEPVEVGKLYATSSAFALFSETEGLPNVAIEAGCNGLYLILSEMSGVARELIPNEDFGIVVNSLDKEINLSLQPDRDRISSYFIDTFSIERVADSTVKVYRTLCR